MYMKESRKKKTILWKLAIFGKWERHQRPGPHCQIFLALKKSQTKSEEFEKFH